MRGLAGNLLIALSVLLLAATLFWIVAGLLDLPAEMNEDQRGAFLAGLLFSGVLLALEVLMFLVGRSMRRPGRNRSARGPGRPAGERVLPLVLYLAGSVAIGLFAAFFRGEAMPVRALFFLVGQPFVFAQLFFGGLLGFKLGPGAWTHAIMIAVNLLYFSALLYPLYAVFTTDRVVEPVRFRRMVALLALLGGIHVLIGCIFAILARA